MIISLFYALTASLVLIGYEALHLLLPPVGLDASWAQRGAILLLVGALLNLWKRRVGAGVALFGAILIWVAWGTVANLAAHTLWLGYGGVGLILLPRSCCSHCSLRPQLFMRLSVSRSSTSACIFPSGFFPKIRNSVQPSRP
jgi:hypothetical protein